MHSLSVLWWTLICPVPHCLTLWLEDSALPQWFLLFEPCHLPRVASDFFPTPDLSLHPRPQPRLALRSHCRIGCSVAPREADSSICQCLLGVSEICDWDIWMQVTPCPWSSHHALPGSPCCVYWCFLSPWAGGSTITNADWIFHKHRNSGHRARKFYYRKRLYQHGLSYLCLWVMDFLNGHFCPFSSAHRHIPFVFHISWIFSKTNIFNQLTQSKIVVVTNTVHIIM